MQRRGPIAFQGERGANSEDAVLKRYGEIPVLPCRTLADAFLEVEEGRAEEALLPVENSLAGTISETFDLLLQHRLLVRGEVDLRVQHCLQALPGQRIEDIHTVYSHPQALAQCSRFLAGMQAEKVAVYDTAGSAKMVGEDRMQGCAAIASARAAEIYGLDILARDIQDEKENYTKFFAIGREAAPREDRSRTVMVLGTDNTPGALYRCLGIFAEKGINICKLESRPSRFRPWEYIFYLIFDGHAEDPAPAEALRELADRTKLLRVLGSYPYHPEEGEPGGTV